MILRVGPFLYRVHFQDAPLIHEGERCLGLCDNETHEIHIATQTSFAQQVQVICHEYMEAWLYHFGHATRDGDAHHRDRAHDRKEAYCDLFGMAMAQFVMDMVRQLDQLSDAMPTQASAEVRHDQNATDASANDAQHESPEASRERIATKLAHAAARAGLKVRHAHHVNATTTPVHQSRQKDEP